MKKKIAQLGLLITLLLLAGCSSGASTVAPQAAASWTPTATPTKYQTTPAAQPTPTSTPVPVPTCPQLASAPAGAAPAASLSLYLAAWTTVLALNPADGSVRWQARVTQDNIFLAALVVASNIVYAATQDGEVVALDAANGLMRWCVAAPGSDPVLAGARGALYVGSSHSTTLLALNGDDGKQLWKTSVAGDPLSLTAAGGQLYVSALSDSSPDAYFQALNPSTGAIRWQKQISNASFSQPVVANGAVYVTEQQYGNTAGYLDAFDASSGTQRWRFQEPQSVGLSQPAAGNSGVYAVDNWGIYALDNTSGVQRWSIQLQAWPNMDPSIMNGLFYFLTSDNGSGPPTVEALDASSGAKRWRWTPDTTALAVPGASSFSPLTGSPGLGYIAGNGAVYVWYSERLTALNGSAGSQQWQVDIPQSGAQPGVMVVG